MMNVNQNISERAKTQFKFLARLKMSIQLSRSILYNTGSLIQNLIIEILFI